MWNLYDIFRRIQAGGESSAIDLTTDTLYMMLVTSDYTVNQNTHDFRDDITNEVTGTGYTSGGNICSVPTFTMDGSGLITLDASDPAAWAQDAGGFADARRAILFYQVGGSMATPATDLLVAYSNSFGSNRSNVTDPFAVELAAAGIWTNAR